MNDLIIEFVSREGWSTAITVIESNYKASNLIPISLVKAVISGAGYTTESQNFLQSMSIAKENELYLQFHVYRKIQYYVSSLKTRYPTGRFKKYQENVTVGGGFNIIKEWLRNGPELTNWCIFYELPRESKIKIVQTKTVP